MKPFNYRKRNLISGPHLLGLILILAGIFALLSPTFFTVGSSMQRVIMVGVGAILIGLFMLFTFEGTLIDFSGNKFKEYTSIGGYKSGEWSPLPKITNIRVTSLTYQSTNTPNGISPTLSVKVTDFKVLLYGDEETPVLSFDYISRDKAMKQAKYMASALKADLKIEV